MENNMRQRQDTVKKLVPDFPTNHGKALMEATFGNDKCIFLADVKKLIHYYKFDRYCIPSFVDNRIDEPIASRNPIIKKAETRFDKFVQILGFVRYEYVEAECLKKYRNKEYIGRKPFFQNMEDALKKGYAIEMPKLWYFDTERNNDKKYHIGELTKQKILFKQEMSGLRIIDESDYCITVDDGQHRIRYFEMIGAPAIYILIPKHQQAWFKQHCSYDG